MHVQVRSFIGEPSVLVINQPQGNPLILSAATSVHTIKFIIISLRA